LRFWEGDAPAGINPAARDLRFASAWKMPANLANEGPFMHDMLRQLRTIAEWQRHLLPRTIPQPTGWCLAVHYAVGRWPGGNYYDFLSLPDGRLLLVVADASDQGAPSSALLGMARVVLHSCPLTSGVEQTPFCPLHDVTVQPPHIILGHLNSVLAANSLEEQFLTAFCAVLNPVDGALNYASAGHPMPRWWRALEGAVEAVPGTAGLPLGLDARASYHQKRLHLEPADVLVCYSDGLVGAQNDAGQTFGRKRIDDALYAAAPDGAQAVRNAVVNRLEEFLGREVVQDDVTLVVVERVD
jgi:sigma-B regulation protein RsbU (phosphoserine phosphatase)